MKSFHKILGVSRKIEYAAWTAVQNNIVPKPHVNIEGALNLFGGIQETSHIIRLMREQIGQEL